METVAIDNGFSKCDSSAVKTISKRHIGSLPYATAFKCAGVGEAKLEDGRRVLITWGRDADKDEQFWYAHNTTFVPIWTGSDSGTCELIIGETFGSAPAEDWLWLGLRIVQEDGTDWVQVENPQVTTAHCTSGAWQLAHQKQ